MRVKEIRASLACRFLCYTNRTAARAGLLAPLFILALAFLLWARAISPVGGVDWFAVFSRVPDHFFDPYQITGFTSAPWLLRSPRVLATAAHPVTMPIRPITKRYLNTLNILSNIVFLCQKSTGRWSSFSRIRPVLWDSYSLE